MIETSKWRRNLMVALFLIGLCSSCLNVVDQRRDPKFMLQPTLSSFGVATSSWCHDLKFFLECSFCLSNSSLVAMSDAGCFGISDHNLRHCLVGRKFYVFSIQTF